MDTREVGANYEDEALYFLKSQGLKLVLRNYRCRGGELDLVMLDGKTLVLIEVRFRRSRTHGGAAASLTITKQRRLILAARTLLRQRRELQCYPVRFDVVAMELNAAQEPTLQWIKQAFIVRS